MFNRNILEIDDKALGYVSNKVPILLVKMSRKISLHVCMYYVRIKYKKMHVCMYVKDMFKIIYVKIWCEICGKELSYISPKYLILISELVHAKK